MANKLKLTSYNIFELGDKLDRMLHDNGVKEKSILIIKVDGNELKKIDEDLYYRNNPKGKDYVPTDGEVIVNFKNLMIKIMVKEKDE